MYNVQKLVDDVTLEWRDTVAEESIKYSSILLNLNHLVLYNVIFLNIKVFLLCM